MMQKPPFAALVMTLVSLVVLTGCKPADLGPPPKPVELTRDATGYFCQMIVLDHSGPKAQIHLANRDEPVYFPSVADALAFLMLPDETRRVRAFYVNDMARAKSWDNPEQGTWIDANTAFFVIDSKRKNWVGYKEAVPFGSEDAANKFIAVNQGRIVRLAQVPSDYVFPGQQNETAPMSRIPDKSANLNGGDNQK